MSKKQIETGKRLVEVDSLRRFVDGAVCATLICLVFFAASDFVDDDAAWVGVFGSLLVAIITLIAARVALAGNRLQLAQVYDLEEERRSNLLVAGKAMLTGTLSDMMEITTNNMQLDFEEVLVIGSKKPFATEFIQLPDQYILSIKECIQHADPISQRRLADIISNFQMLESRERTLNKGKLSPTDVTRKLSYAKQLAIDDAIHWAVTHALIEDTLQFARGASENVSTQVPVERVKAAFLRAHVILGEYQPLLATIDNRAAHGRLFINWTSADS